MCFHFALVLLLALVLVVVGGLGGEWACGFVLARAYLRYSMILLLNCHTYCHVILVEAIAKLGCCGCGVWGWGGLWSGASAAMDSTSQRRSAVPSSRGGGDGCGLQPPLAASRWPLRFLTIGSCRCCIHALSSGFIGSGLVADVARLCPAGGRALGVPASLFLVRSVVIVFVSHRWAGTVRLVARELVD